VNFIVGDGAIDEKPKWQKCKLRLVKASGGFLLEFFAPPKVGKHFIESTFKTSIL
jgi:hypothetical protein